MTSSASAVRAIDRFQFSGTRFSPRSGMLAN
jgi:hypothetical protein